MATELVDKLKKFGIGAILLYGLTLSMGLHFSSFAMIIFAIVVAFLIYSACVVFNMASSFNSCKEAKAELSEEVQEALAYFEGIGFSCSTAAGSSSPTRSFSSR